MKKLTLILTFFLIVPLLIPKNIDEKMVMSEVNNSSRYELVFNNDNLNISNFKLKLGLFSSYDYNITKIYINYNESIKDYFKNKPYFSFDSSNFNDGIEKLKEEYNLVLKQNYLYSELDKDINNVSISKVEIYTVTKAIIKFKTKYPNVVIRQLK